MAGGKKKKENADHPPSYEDATGRGDDEPPFANDDCCMRMIKKYVACSFFRFVMRRLGRLQDHPDQDLDIEHHLPFSKSNVRRAAIVQMDNKRIRCYRLLIVTLIFSWLAFAFAVPLGMILTGVFQTEQCPYMNHLIVIYLIISGIVSLLYLLIRLFLCSCQVCVSCYRDRLPGTALAMTVCCVEILAFVILFFLLAWLGVGIYYIYYLQNVDSQRAVSENLSDLNLYCASSVLIPAIVFLTLQIAIIPWSLITCTAICCGAYRCCCVSLPPEEIPTTAGKKRTLSADAGAAAATTPGSGSGSGKTSPVDDAAV